MDAGADRYLHKKFKKQLSIEPRTNNTTSTSSNAPTDQSRGGESVPTPVTHHSTNRNETSVNLSVLNYVKSSISSSLVINEDDVVANRRSVELERNAFGEQSTIDISYVSSSSRLNQTEPTTVVTTSSILINSCSYKETCSDEKQQEKGVPGGKYVCTYCNLACSKPSVLQKHIRAHTNERPYPCVSCGFSFKTRSNLYKHCRSRSHANRVMGNKVQEISSEAECGDSQGKTDLPEPPQTPEAMEHLQQPLDFKSKPYKPRFHTAKSFYDENTDENSPQHQQSNEQLSSHINDLIDKNNTIVNNTPESYVYKHNDEVEKVDEPLNLTNKNRKRCLSEVSEPATQKSLIKELLLKNLYADTNMQCPHCKMIFQTVTELELHKMRNCRGMTKSGPRYSRSSSVNVASILTQNKNAFDNIPQMQNAVFPLKSPGPFLGKTRLVESDKTKSFSFEDGIQGGYNGIELLRNNTPPRYSLSPISLSYDKTAKRTPVKLFGGEVKITQTTGETKSFKIDSKEDKYATDYDYKMSENRVVKSTLQSGGTVMQNKPAYNKPEPLAATPEVIRVYDTTPTYEDKNKLTPTNGLNDYKYTNIVDFSQNAAKLLAPNLKQLNLTIPGVPVPSKFIDSPLLTTTSEQFYKKQPQIFPQQQNGNVNPLNLLINGKVVRYVPGMPGPVVAEQPTEQQSVITTVQKQRALVSQRPNILITPVDKKDEPQEVVKSEQPSPKHSPTDPPRRFARPNSLSLKPSACSMKQHHGLTPTMFNQILISPDTPRGAKKYNEHFLHGNYFSYLDLKSSTKPVYCTLNKTQPFYVPHFKKLSMYSEWRQQDNKADKLYVSAYDSRQRTQRYSTAGSYAADYIVHSSYKFSACETSTSKDESQKNAAVLGGYESNEDYTYVRGRGRGRYVCDQCGIRCKKPSMLKKHIRTHSNDRPYTCKHCNFSFKTKGNLTKHMKSKAHTKNYVASGGSSSSSSAQQSGTQSEDSDTDDSGMDSSDESSTRQQEHEAAYGLLSLSQKPASTMHMNIDACSPSSVSLSPIPSIAEQPSFMNAEQLVHVSKTNYVKNKILDQQQRSGMFKLSTATTVTTASPHEESTNRLSQYLGISNMSRTLTYPYTSVHSTIDVMDTDSISETQDEPEQEKPNITNFNVIKRYNPQTSRVASYVESCRNKLEQESAITRAVESEEVGVLKKRRMMFGPAEGPSSYKHPKSETEVIDLSMGQEKVVTPMSNGHAEHENIRKYYESVEKTKSVYNHFASEEPHTPTTLVYHDGAGRVEGEGGSRVNYVMQENPVSMGSVNNVTKKPVEYDNSAMETLADIATKQEKLEKNSVAKNVASEFLKLATKNEYPNGEDKTFVNNNKDVNDMVVKTEENKSCTICSKNFSKPSQLRLHMNIHYLERPFRCESCSVSFRTKGHLQKHERSASHHNKLSSSPALSSSEPRPFKCGDCNIAFRIHGHLAKHLRSKMHIMKLECSGKIPFGLYAELERSNSLLTEINTADGDQCLDSLKMLAKKVFINDPSKLTQLEERSSAAETDTDS